MYLIDVIDPKNGVVAGIGAVIGAVLLKILDRMFQAKDLVRQHQLADESDIRKELREEIKDLRDSLAAVSLSLDDWKNKYYVLIASNAPLINEIAKLQSQNEGLRNAINKLVVQVDALTAMNTKLLAEVETLQRVLRPLPDSND